MSIFTERQGEILKGYLNQQLSNTAIYNLLRVS